MTETYEKEDSPITRSSIGLLVCLVPLAYLGHPIAGLLLGGAAYAVLEYPDRVRELVGRPRALIKDRLEDNDD